MNRKFLPMAAAALLLLAEAPVMPASATENEGTTNGTFMPSPKKKSKSSSTVSSILGSVFGSSSETSSSSSSSSSSIVSALTSIFDSNKTASADDLVGTWEYEEPAVVFESDNALKSFGGKVASSAIEKKLQTQFSKFGITKGKMKMKFDKDGNFTQTIGSRNISGTYKIDGQQVVLTYTGGVKQLVGKTQLDGNNLLIVMEADKLLKYASALGKLTGNSTISTLSSLANSYDGMEVGLKLAK